MVKIEKITLNIGVGASGEKLENAKRLLEKLSEQKPIETISRKRIPTWNLRKGLPIGVKVTVRGKKARELLNLFLDSVGRKLNASSFDKFGNFSFGVREYIDIPGVKYDPKIGMFGFDVNVTIANPGYSIKRRKIKPASIPLRHMITKEEAVNFVTKELNVEVVQ